METVWILGDQLNRHNAALQGRAPGAVRVLMVESRALLRSRRWHRQRLHLVLASMRRFAIELSDRGFEVDYQIEDSFTAGFKRHIRQHCPDHVTAMEPSSWDGRRLLERLGVEFAPSNQFLCHYNDFAVWAAGRERLVLEDFYRWQRRRLDVLMDGEEPAGGRWNYDAENREPPPPERDRTWAGPIRSRLDDLDREVLSDLPANVFGTEPSGIWATSRRAALARLRHFVDELLPGFGPHEDAMLADNWHLAHSLLSSSLNLGLLMPDEVCRAAEAAYRAGRAPIASVEGFIRQIIGWREYFWGLYWLWIPEYRAANELDAHGLLPPVFTGQASTRMRCLESTLDGIEERGYAHHIQRLMIIGNLALLTGTSPRELVDWMWASFIDGAEWVMLPNVLGMALYADGGRMATKPYAAGGRYINRMSDYCGKCFFDPSQRVGETACPYTTLYWDFLARNRDRLKRNHRLARQLRMLDRLDDLPAVRQRALEVSELLAAGVL